MTWGFVLSGALHLAVFLLFLLAPRPPAFDWDRADAISVELVPAPTPPEETPVEVPPEPEPEPVVEAPPEPTPPADVTPPEPEPVRQTKPKKPKPRYVFRPIAPSHPEDEGPSLEERLQQRLHETEERAEEGPTPPPSVPAASSAEVTASDFPYAWYLNQIRRKITDAWDPPGDRMIAGHANRVLIRFRIHRDGRVTEIRTDGGSGTPGLDASARRAVEQAKPFPPLPDAYEGESLDVAVRFTVEGGA